MKDPWRTIAGRTPFKKFCGSFPTRQRPDRNLDAGDTLLEILITLVIISLALVALMGAFTTTINASADYRNASNLNTALVDVTQNAIAQLQQQAAPLFTPCATATIYNNKLNLTLPGYTITVTAVDDLVGGNFVPVNPSTCNPTSPASTAPQEIFLSANRTGSIATAPIAFVIDDRGGAPAAALPTSVITVYSTPPTTAYVNGTYDLSQPKVPSATSGDVVQISSENTGVCTVSMTTYLVTFLAPGSCVLDFNDAGNANYNPATTIRQPFTVVAQNSNTISFRHANPSPVSVNSTYDPGASSSLLATVIGQSSNSAVCNVSSSTGVIQFLSVGNCSITFSDPGNAAYVAATPVTWNITVTKATQNALVLTSTTGTYGNKVNLTSSGGSGTGQVSYSVLNGTATGCTIDASGLVLSSTSAGTCSVTVSKAGDLTYLPQSNTANVTFAPAILTVTASAGTMTYGGTPPTVTALYSGFVNGDTSSVLTQKAICATNVTSTTGAGTAFGADTCSGAAAANYTPMYLPANVVIQKAPLTITASSTSVPYGGTPTVTALYSGFVNQENPSNLTTAPSCGSPNLTPTSTPGTPNLTTNCTNAVDNNYAISYVSGILTVTRATLTITANNLSVNHGASITPTSTISGFANSDAATLMSATYTYVGTGTTNYGPSTVKPTAAGTYSMVPSGAILNFTRGSSANYTYTYAPGTLTITTISAKYLASGAEPKYNTNTIVSSTFTADPGATVLILVAIEDSGAQSCTSLSPSAALSTYAAVTSATTWDTTGGTYRTCSFSAKGTGAPGTLTVNLNTGTFYGAMQIIEITGDNGAYVNQAATWSGTNNSPKVTLSPPTGSYEVFYGDATNGTNPLSWSSTSPTGFIQVGSQLDAGGGSSTYSTSAYFGPSSTTVTGSISTSAPWGTIGIEIKP